MPLRLTRRTLLKVCLALGVRSSLIGCSAASTPLEGTEVREYQGTSLSSVTDFRENSIRGPQRVDMGKYRLEVTGLVDKPLSLTYEQAREGQQYQKVVTLHCVEGWDAVILWEGLLIDDLLRQAGAQSEAVTLIFHAADGYTSSLPLDFVRQNRILLAHKMNGVALLPERGFPFHLVAESKWGYKWVRWVQKIELSADPDYLGFWESQGYSNQGDEFGPMFEFRPGFPP